MSKGSTLILVFTAVVVLCVTAFFSPSPSHNRDWVEDMTVLANATTTQNSVELYGVRDWQYSEDGAIDKVWHEQISVNPEEITQVWFVLEPFGKVQAIGHSFLSFEFADGQAYSFSVEARRENGEGYSSFVGVLPKYELIYVWGTERDLITRRLVMLDHPVHMYPLELPHDDSVALFKTLASATNELFEKPRFYNTLTANCTNMLAKIINSKYPGEIPYNISWNLPGFSDGFLYNEGFLKTELSFDELRGKSKLNPHKEVLKAAAASSTYDFTQKVREVLSSPSL